MSLTFRQRYSIRAVSQSLRCGASKVVCIGRNYADHVAELNSSKPKQPFFFLKPPSSILLPGEGPVIRPRGVNLHYEVELALIIGKKVKDLEESNTQCAFDAIQSYALCIDMTARNIQDEAKKKGLPWSIAKGFDTFLPMSNAIPKSTIPDPHNIELYLRVNDEPKPRQQDNTNLFLFKIPQILASVSKVFTLEVGDIVITGTPKGVGSVVPGDTISAGIRSHGNELEDAKIRVKIVESSSSYNYKET
ncbi:putative fumarylacetoacetate hydrolase domain-containing protein 1 [Erysiphe necator]|uniref:Putative fumarylacetoacetate hydrolase domain-containing protein 1 n=1 Tax=Uncinula necator TaxID=52586 RepID=A0A0B1P7Y2_UNCNE|nr:putative fumarylacetoacetate hydrolase domain-containing protein 1 [Erysiphe necator]